MTTSYNMTQHKGNKCKLHQNFVLFLWMKHLKDQLTGCMSDSPGCCPIVSLTSAFSHFPDAHALHSPQSYHFQDGIVLGYQAWPSECAAQNDTSPACHTERQKQKSRQAIGKVLSFEKIRLYTDGSVICNAFILYSYCVRAGELAGDVECNEVFPNNNIRHTVTIISHLGVNKRYHCKYSSPSRQQGEILWLRNLFTCFFVF